MYIDEEGKEFKTYVPYKMGIREFKKIIKTIKWTPPQQKIVDNILDGDLIWVINKHHASGGEWNWKYKGTSYPSYAGKVYRAFWNVVHKVGLSVDDNHLSVPFLFYKEKW